MAAKKPVAQESEEVTPPTLSAAVAASNEAEQQRIAGLVEKASGTTTAEPAPKAKTPDEEYDEWVAGLPEDKRSRFETSIHNKHAEGLAGFYGPEITAVLEAAGKDPEIKKMLGRMSDAKAREWVQKTALAIYDDDRFASPAGSDGPVPKDPRYDALESEVRTLKTERENEKQQQTLQALRSEREALENTFPELKWSDPKSKEYKRVEAVVEETMDRRAKGSDVTMADVYGELKDMWDWQTANPPPRAIPATSSGAVPPNPQAPRTKFEARAGINAMLDKHGSIGQLAAALKR